MKHDVLNQYGLPKEVRYCKRCTISNQRPRITFDSGGYAALAGLQSGRIPLIGKNVMKN